MDLISGPSRTCRGSNDAILALFAKEHVLFSRTRVSVELSREILLALIAVEAVNVVVPDDAENPLPAEIKSKAESRADQLLAELPETFSFALAKEKCEEMGIAERTLKRWLKVMVEEKKIVRLEKGEYKKL